MPQKFTILSKGGAIVCHDAETKKHIDNLKNFGFVNETTVVTPGINAKMNEIQAAMGLLQLKYIDTVIGKRKRIVEQYRLLLKNISGLTFMEDIPGVKHSLFLFFQCLLIERIMERLGTKFTKCLKKNNIYGRRYFYPLISQFPIYNELANSQPGELTIAEGIAEKVICLPIYPEIEVRLIKKICAILKVN